MANIPPTDHYMKGEYVRIYICIHVWIHVCISGIYTYLHT